MAGADRGHTAGNSAAWSALPEDKLTIDTGSSTPDVADDEMPPARDRADELAPVPGSSTLGVRKSRCCLKCQSTFESEWNGERLCRRCKSKSGWRQGRQAGGKLGKA